MFPPQDIQTVIVKKNKIKIELAQLDKQSFAEFAGYLKPFKKRLLVQIRKCKRSNNSEGGIWFHGTDEYAHYGAPYGYRAGKIVKQVHKKCKRNMTIKFKAKKGKKYIVSVRLVDYKKRKFQAAGVGFYR